jgi:putative CRISPR-associated protein (TIGR02619 family)
MSQRKPILMISTCGTSLLTNKADKNTQSLLRNKANFAADDLSLDQKNVIDARIAECKSRLINAETLLIKELSAELNGLFAYYEDQLSSRPQDQHFLIHTDTYLGVQTAQILEEFLRSRNLNVERITFPNLRTDTLQNFQGSIIELINWSEKTFPGYHESKYHIVFNLTGGFKSIQGWMQTLGMFYADEIVYIFESSQELLRIPRIPVDIDNGMLNVVKQHTNLFRKLYPRGTTCKLSEVKGIHEAFFYQLNDEAELSPWGNLVWERLRKCIYSEKLLEPPTNCIHYSENFMKSANSLSKNRIMKLNERIDDLAYYLRTNKNLNRLDFKQLKGNPKPPSTHECDAWSNDGAWRIFAHFDDKQLVLDDICEGLH